MRPVGAVIFGFLADRYGRRTPLMANVVFFSVVELLCGFAPNYTVFLVLRTIYGIGMGGEWGVGSSLAMESVPPKWRGTISGIVQSGYSTGYLLAALAAKIVLPLWGWRAMFWVGGIPALLAFYIRYRVKESEAWKQHRAPTVGAILRTAREQKGVTLAKAEQGTRIRQKYLEALEEGRYDLLPCETYIRGFLRAYAKYLELDDEQLLRQYREERHLPKDERERECACNRPCGLYEDRARKTWWRCPECLVDAVLAQLLDAVGQSLAESSDGQCICPWRVTAEETDHRHGLLLRTRCERPRRHRAADQRYEFPPPHSITSSARASSDGGTSRPSAFAVLRLKMSSNFVGCSIGRSAGLAPLRMRSTKYAARRYRPRMSTP